MRHEWKDPERGRVYAVENGNFYELEAKGPRLIEGRQVSNREILRLAERDERWTEYVNSWMEILGMEPGKTDEDFDDALKALVERERKLREAASAVVDAIGVSDDGVAWINWSTMPGAVLALRALLKEK